MPASEKPSITLHNPPITKGRRASACNLLLLAVLILSLCSCATCRQDALQDAKEWQEKGHEVRISVYCLSSKSKIFTTGSGHAQAQIKWGEEWKWIGKSGDVEDEPTYGFSPMVINGKSYNYLYYSIEEFDKLYMDDSTPKENYCGSNYWWILWLLIAL
jgi:hypothetical protein